MGAIDSGCGCWGHVQSLEGVEEDECRRWEASDCDREGQKAHLNLSEGVVEVVDGHLADGLAMALADCIPRVVWG